jgi:nucleoside diphosphate-linked moiety X motif protein 19
MWLAPPQVYEMSRLCHFQRLKELKQFAAERELKGSERWMPVRIKCQDGIIALLPGELLTASCTIHAQFIRSFRRCHVPG